MRRIELKFIKDPRLRRLISAAGSVRQARNELRWIQQELPSEKVTSAIYLRGRMGVPLQYILGSQPFGPLDISCRKGVLIPRWETEEWALELTRRWNAQNLITNQNIDQDNKAPTQILDIGTGSGCISFLLNTQIPNSRVTALDISPDAISLFKHNQQKLGLEKSSAVVRHNLHDPLPSTLRPADIVVSNPPYIKEISDADFDVRKFEPELALLEQPEIYEDLVTRAVEAHAQLAVFEVGNKQQIDLCTALFRKHKYRTWGQKDSAGNWRTVWATKHEQMNQ